MLADILHSRGAATRESRSGMEPTGLRLLVRGLGEWDFVSVSSIVVSGTSVYVGGMFPGISGVLQQRRPVGWHILVALAIPGRQEGVISYPGNHSGGNSVYASGTMLGPDGVFANNVARWDGTAGLPSERDRRWPSPTVYALAISGTDLYVGGLFTHAGGMTANNIARWNGQRGRQSGLSWSCL